MKGKIFFFFFRVLIIYYRAWLFLAGIVEQILENQRGISLTLTSAWSWTDLEVPEGPCPLYCPDGVQFVPIYNSQCTFLVRNTPAHKLSHSFNLFESESLTPGQDLYYVEVVLNCEEDL